MERTISYKIEKLYEGQKISTFLKFRGFSEKNLVWLKKDETSILLNGEYRHQNCVLKTGDKLLVHIRELKSSTQIIPVELPVNIVYEDEDFMVVNKPAGMPVHPSRNNFDNSLGNALAWYFKQQNQPFVYRCMNRLDRDTSGLTIVAKHMVSAAVFGKMLAGKNGNMSEKNEIKREYLAIVQGKLKSVKGVIDAPIARKESLCLERMVDFEKGERAVTHYQVIKEGEDCSLVRLWLETGRTHQIRVHMKYLGHPLLGDFLYHPDYSQNQTDRVKVNMQKHPVIARQALHACRLMFPHPMTGEHMEFEVPIPEDMQKVINGKLN